MLPSAGKNVAKIYFATQLRSNIFVIIMKAQVNWDVLGIATSVACAVHCALLPLILTSLPLFGINIIHNNIFEAAMITLAFIIGSLALYHGYKRHHHRFLPIWMFSAGFIFLVLKEIFITYEIWLLIPAVSLILCAHFFNFRFCRNANHCRSTDCNH